MPNYLVDNFTIERTSACHSPDNPGGFGFEISFNDGKDSAEIVIPDSVVEIMSSHLDGVRSMKKESAYCPRCGETLSIYEVFDHHKMCKGE